MRYLGCFNIVLIAADAAQRHCALAAAAGAAIHAADTENWTKPTIEGNSTSCVANITLKSAVGYMMLVVCEQFKLLSAGHSVRTRNTQQPSHTVYRGQAIHNRSYYGGIDSRLQASDFPDFFLQ